MAFLSSSPPPMIPDDIEDVDDFEDQLDEDEEDSASYDLTGLSEKLHSIPKEAIQVLPKEVTLPSNGIIPDIPLEKVNRWNDGGGTLKESMEKSHNEVEPSIEEEMGATNEPTENESDKESLTEDILVNPPEVNDLTQSGEQLQDNELNLSDSFEIDDDDKNNPEDAVNGMKENDENDVNSFNSRNSSPKIDYEKEENFVEKGGITQTFYEDEDDFGEFDSANVVHDEGKDDGEEEGEDDDEFGNFEEMQQQQKVPPLTLDEDVNVEEKSKEISAVEDCDEFGDFASNQEGNANVKSLSFASAAGWASLDSSPRGKLDQILIGLQLKLAAVISSLYLSQENSASDDMSAERVQPLDFDREDCEDHVWHLVHNIQSTPALNQKWKDTEGRSRLLTFLKIDPKNVNEFSVMPKPSKPSSSLSNIPAFASGLGATLEPLKVETKVVQVKEPKKEEESTIPPKSSDPASVMPIPPAFGTSLLPNEEDFKGTSTLAQTKRGKTEHIKSKNSSAAQTIINSFPLLDFMNHSKLSEPS